MKALILIVMATLSMSAFAKCGLHITNLDDLLDDRDLFSDVKYHAEKRGYELKSEISQLENGDLFLGGFILERDQNYYLAYKEIVPMKAKLGLNGFYRVRDFKNVIYDYSNSALVHEFYHNQIRYQVTISTEYKINAKQIKRKFGEGFIYTHEKTKKIQADVVKTVISELPKCKK